MKIDPAIKPGNKFPDFELPDQDGNMRQLSRHMNGWPTIVTFYRGKW